MLQDGDIVYDVRFTTNDLGFIDHEDYSSDGDRPADAPRLVFVGDSYTAGFHGGTPWVPALRDDARRADPDLAISTTWGRRELASSNSEDCQETDPHKAPSRSKQRVLRLAAVVRCNLYAFVIQGGMKALDVMLEQDREALWGRLTKRAMAMRPCGGDTTRAGS
jgi:hypothetical protein